MSERAIAVIGSGAWGTAIAVHAAGLGFRVRQWVREPELVAAFRERRENPLFLPGVMLPDTLEATIEIGAAVAGVELVVAAVPAQYARSIYAGLAPDLPGPAPLLVLTKGIEEETLALPLRVVAETLGPARACAVLSGPSFAGEVARGRPTAVVVASVDAALARSLQHALSSSTLRLYTNTDVVGVQLAGALKNVMAISAGMADGLGMGHNARAALITRGLAEITRLGRRLGGKAATFSGLAGLGDLVLTCTDDQSRNRSVGRRLAQGERLEDIVGETRSVAEGVRTTRSAIRLARETGVALPIVEEVYRILYEGGSVHESLRRLMERPLISEEPE